MSADNATAAVKLQAVLKSPRERLTIASLRAALDELEAVANVPADADLTVVHYQQGGWEATAKWIPDGSSKSTVNVHPGAVVINPGRGVTDDEARRITRRLTDNPQA